MNGTKRSDSYGSSWREMRRQLLEHPPDPKYPIVFKPLNCRQKTDSLDRLSHIVGWIIFVLAIVVSAIQLWRWVR